MMSQFKMVWGGFCIILYYIISLQVRSLFLVDCVVN